MSDLDTVIPAEIIDDTFSLMIRAVASRPEVSTIIEIGSSDGSGSTQSLIDGVGERGNVDLYCLELSEVRFASLVKRYSAYDWVHCVNLPSLPLDQMPNVHDVAVFFDANPGSPMCKFKLAEVQRWLLQDIDYIAKRDWPEWGIVAARSWNTTR